MKRIIVLSLVAMLSLAGCDSQGGTSSADVEQAEKIEQEEAKVVQPEEPEVVEVKEQDQKEIADEEPQEPQEKTREYVLNTKSMKFHRTSCSSVDDISDNNRKDVECTRSELIDQGYEPCQRCKP